MERMRKVIQISLFIFLLADPLGSIIFCQSKSHEKHDFLVPMGVDSAVAYKAWIKSERLFVDLKKQNKSDSLLNNSHDHLIALEELFTILREKKEALEKKRVSFQEFKKNYEKHEKQQVLTLAEKREYKKRLEEISHDSLAITIVTDLIYVNLDYCKELFQKAYEIDPFKLVSSSSSLKIDWISSIIIS